MTDWRKLENGGKFPSMGSPRVNCGVPYSGHFLEHSIFDSKMSPIPDTVYILLCVPLSLPRLVATHTLALNLSRNLRAKVHGFTCECTDPRRVQRKHPLFYPPKHAPSIRCDSFAGLVL